jgi:hypothetical protein
LEYVAADEIRQRDWLKAQLVCQILVVLEFKAYIPAGLPSRRALRIR